MGTPEPVTDSGGLKSVARGLLDGWAVERGSMDLGQRDRFPDAARFVVIHCLAAHTHRLADAALILSDADRPLEAMPLIRGAFESAITAVWLAQNEDGGRAFANEFGRQQRAMGQTLAKSTNPIFASGVLLPHKDGLGLDSNSDAQARWFQQLCEDFDGGADLYIYYRMMSALSHAGMKVVDQYVVPTETGDDVEGLLKVPRFSPDSMWLFFLTASMVWAGTAVDYIDMDRGRRSELRNAAKTIGITRDLPLTSAARARIRRKTAGR